MLYYIIYGITYIILGQLHNAILLALRKVKNFTLTENHCVIIYIQKE